jgi:hypothetical protein
LLLLRRQGHHGILDFGKSAHGRILTHARTPDKSEARSLKYILKPVDMTFEGVGRFCGMIGRKHVPWSACSQQGMDVRAAVWIKRIARR